MYSTQAEYGEYETPQSRLKKSILTHMGGFDFQMRDSQPVPVEDEFGQASVVLHLPSRIAHCSRAASVSPSGPRRGVHNLSFTRHLGRCGAIRLVLEHAVHTHNNSSTLTSALFVPSCCQVRGSWHVPAHALRLLAARPHVCVSSPLLNSLETWRNNTFVL